MTPRPQLPATRPIVSSFLKGRLGGTARVHAFYDRDESHVVAIVEATGTPTDAMSTCATASLHTQPNLLEGDDIRVEFLIVAGTELTESPNIIATAAFFVIKDGWLAAPGVVFPDLVREYHPATTTPHVMWTEPFDVDGVSTVSLVGVGHDIHFLQAVPISEAERRLLVRDGYDALSDLLLSAGVDHTDVQRASAC